MPNRKISPEPDSRIIVGYHGTSVQRAELAMKDRGLLLSRGDRGDWLAEGAYFWENSLDRAQRWAHKRHSDSPAVLRAEIRLGRCLDLTDSKWNDAVKAGYQELEDEYVMKGLLPPENRGHHHFRDHEVINHLCERKFSVDTVRGAFEEGEEIYEGGPRDLTHVQVAVRNPEMILSLERSYPFPFKAYLASALTGLTELERKEIDAIQDIIKEKCKSRGIAVYLPRDKTDPEKHKDVPPEQVFFADIEEVLNSDLLILMTNYPSFGGGMELKTALDALLPILLISPHEAQLSRMVRGIPSQRSYHVRYGSHEELQIELDRAIGFLRQNITDRKDRLKSHEIVVGGSIEKLREKLGLSKEELAAAVGITPEALTRLEESPDYLTNPSLLLLRKFAQTLDSTTAEIADPEHLGIVARQVFELVQEGGTILEARQAKGSKLPPEDQLRVLLVALEGTLNRAKELLDKSETR